MNGDDAAEPTGTRRIGRLIILLVGAGLLALIVAGAFGVRTLARNEEANAWVQHTREVEVDLGILTTLIERSEAARRGYVIEADPRYRDTWQSTSKLIPPRIADLQRLISDNAAQVARARALEKLFVRQNAIAARTTALVDRGDIAGARTAFRAYLGAETVGQVRAVVAAMAEAEAYLLTARERTRQMALRTFYAIAAASAILVLLIILACIVIIRRYTAEINTSRAELRLLNVDLESAVRDRTSELQRANDEIQRFAYIVSHDLRSPLVNVMGFTAEMESAQKPLTAFLATLDEQSPKLVPADARLAVEEDLPEAIRFIRASTQKMDRLINAILKLSREGRRAVAPEWIDMNALLAEIADVQRYPAEQAGAELLIDPALPGLTSDRLSMEQIFSNLIENALKYLAPGRPGQIRVTGRQSGDRVVYEVADNGRGIDPRDHQRVFDLFRRSGEQDQPGEGIGLAHVRSLVWRLGGAIEVQSALDEGATFRLSMPREFTGEGQAL